MSNHPKEGQSVALYQSRPFQNRNAENFELPEVLDLFVDPVPDLVNPFGYENSIIKGRMGSGKTMFLRANLAYHLYGILPALLEDEPPIIPVFIRLSDFQHLEKSRDVYGAVVIKILEGLIQAYNDVQSAKRMAKIHQGIQALPSVYTESPKLPGMFRKLARLTSKEYVETIKTNVGIDAAVKPEFFEAAAKYQREQIVEIKSKREPGISDIHEAYELLLKDYDGRIVLLIDEAGSLGKSFFADGAGASLFETLMNQLRTSEFIRTKIAIYPNSYSDILHETRYGDLVELTENIWDPVGYSQFRSKAIAIIERYASRAAGNQIRAREVFELDAPEAPKDDSLEQIIYASAGNIRRLVQVLDQSMIAAFADHGGNGPVSAGHVINALKRQSHSSENIYSESDREFLDGIAKVCKNRNTFRFQFPYKAPALLKYTSKSEEHNLLNVVSAGAGRRKTMYAFDYAYCVNHDLPTHVVKTTEKIDKTRSTKTGEWIARTAQLSEELVNHANFLKKIDGTIEFIHKQSGMIKDSGGKSYWFAFSDVMDDDQEQPIVAGKRVRFFPAEFEGEPAGVAVEIL